MKKYIKIILIAYLFLANVSLMFGQELWLELGDKYFDQFDYYRARKFYEGASKRGIKNWEVLAKIGDCYYFTLEFDDAKDNYEEAFKKMSDTSASYLLKYARSLQLSISNADDSIKVKDAYNKYYKKIGYPNYVNGSYDNSLPITPENLSINTEYSEFGTFIYDDILYFSSSRENPDKKKRYNKRLYKWNAQPFLDIYTSRIRRNGDSDSLKLIPPDSSSVRLLNTVTHEGSVAISKFNDQEIMYFSRGLLKKNKDKKDYNKQGTSNLKLRRATKNENGLWEVKPIDSTALKFLDFEYFSVGNPALSPDGTKLFFVSCAPFKDAKGQSDIYYIDIDKNGDLIENSIHNVPGINTNDRQSFPFVSEDSTLYFSSNANYKNKLGFGLMDIYKVENIYTFITEGNEMDSIAKARNYNEKQKDSLYDKLMEKIENLGSPYNSPKDDFAYFEEPQTSNNGEVFVYFSSNWEEHPNAKGDDDIYRIKIRREIPTPKKRVIKIVTINSITEDTLKNTFVDVFDSEGMFEKKLELKEGSTILEVEEGKSYNLRGFAESYYNANGIIDSASEENKIVLRLKPFPCKITIYHEFNDSTIIKEGINKNKKYLEPILEFLIANPGVKLKIESYTDSRGSQEYNLKELSIKRALASKAYLIKEGVEEGQIISADGFGEANPVCSDEEIKELNTVDEKERAHQKNRRSTFVIYYPNAFKSCVELDLGNL